MYPPGIDTGIKPDEELQALLNGQCYRAHWQATIGGAAAGFYGMALFNPSTSSKSVLITAVRGWINNSNIPLIYLLKDTGNPAMGNNATIVNDDFGVAVASVATVTYTTAATGVSFPGTTNIATGIMPASNTVEFKRQKGAIARLPAGSAFSLQALMFVANSAQYGVMFEWREY